jgi:ATP-dependent Clp protease ATP-binding subunit ClpA
MSIEEEDQEEQEEEEEEQQQQQQATIEEEEKLLVEVEMEESHLFLARATRQALGLLTQIEVQRLLRLAATTRQMVYPQTASTWVVSEELCPLAKLSRS